MECLEGHELFEWEDAFGITTSVHIVVVVLLLLAIVAVSLFLFILAAAFDVLKFDRPEEVKVEDWSISVQDRPEFGAKFYDGLVHGADVVAGSL